MQNSQQEVPACGSNEATIDLLRQVEGLGQLLAQGCSLAALGQTSAQDEAGLQMIPLSEEVHSQYRRGVGGIGD